MAVLCPQARKYLDFLAAHPDQSRKQIEKAIGSGSGSAMRWSKAYGQDFRGEEETTRARFKIAQLKARQAADALARGKQLPGGPAPIDSGELELRMARFLDYYSVSLHRTDAIRKCQAEGLDLQWEDVEDEIGRNKDFRRRFFAVFNRGIVETEDQVLARGREGKPQQALAVVKAYKPEKYGNRLKVTVQGGIQLGFGDRAAVEDSKEQGAVRRWQLRAAQSAAALAPRRMAEDVVDAEFVEAAVN